MNGPLIPKPRRLLRAPPFGTYLGAVAGWFFGFGLQSTLFPGVVSFTLLESPDRLGLAQAALTAPMLLLLPLAGVAAERTDRRRLIGAFHLVAGLAAAGMSALIFAGLLQYELLLGYALIVGTAGAFVLPARDSAINPITRVTQRLGRRELTLQKAVILASMTQFGAQIAGMGAGVAARFVGPAPLFAIQAAGLIAGGLCALLMPRLDRRAPPERRESILASLADGLAAVARSPVLLPMTLIMVAVGLLIVGGGFFVIIPVLVREAYGGGYALLATLMVCFWIGAFTANVLLARRGAIERPGRALLYAQLVTVASMAAFAAPLPQSALFGLVFFWGLGAGVAISLSRAVVQEHAPADKIARVMSVYQLGLSGGMPLGAAATGFIVEALGPRPAALIPAAGLLAVLAWITLATPILQVRRTEPGGTPISSGET